MADELENKALGDLDAVTSLTDSDILLVEHNGVAKKITWGSLKNSWSALAAYPVGSVYVTASSTSPASLFGGTWEKLQGKFLLGSSSNYTAGSSGGAETVTLTTYQMPTHNHIGRIATTQSGFGYNPGTYEIIIGNPAPYIPTSPAGGSIYQTKSPVDVSDQNWKRIAPTQDTGSGQSHNNMPPYIVVHIWKRTA